MSASPSFVGKVKSKWSQSNNDLQEENSHLIEFCTTRRHKQWFFEDTFLSLMRVRVIESNAPDTDPDAFYCRNIVMWQPA